VPPLKVLRVSKVRVAVLLVAVAFWERVRVVALATERMVVPAGIPVPVTVMPGKRLAVLETVTAGLPVVSVQLVRVYCGRLSVRVPVPDLTREVEPVMGAPVKV
jgi:hypothetical protein